MANPRKILIVDDDPDLRGTLAEQLTLHEEFQAHAVETGAQAIDAAKKEQVDLVIRPEDALAVVAHFSPSGRSTAKTVRTPGVLRNRRSRPPW